MVPTGRQILFRQTLLRHTLFRQSAVTMTQYTAPLGICRNSRNWKNIGGGRGVVGVESTARQFEPHAYWVWLFKLSYQNFEMTDPIWGSNSSLIFGIWFGVFPIGTAFNCSQPLDVPTVDCRNSVCRNRVCRNSVVYPYGRWVIVGMTKDVKRLLINR